MSRAILNIRAVTLFSIRKNSNINYTIMLGHVHIILLLCTPRSLYGTTVENFQAGKILIKSCF